MWTGFPAGRRRAALDPVEDRLGDLVLGCRSGPAARRRARRSRDLVVVALEADLRARDVVEDDRVGALALELGARALDAVRAGLRGEADIVWPSARRGEGGEDVLGRLEASVDAAALALDLVLGGARAAGSRRARPPSAESARSNSASSASPSSAAVSTSIRSTPARRRAARRWRRPGSPRPHAAPRGARAPGPSARSSGCRRSAPGRSARGSRRRVTSTRRPSQGAPPPGSTASTSGQALGLGQPADAVLAARGQRALVGLDHDARRARGGSRDSPGSRRRGTYGRSSPGRRGAAPCRRGRRSSSIESAIPAASLAIVFAEAGATR